ncbi:leucine-rich repeat protein [Acetitomaculum ruminis]|uniref:leucine-rich repeat protein n=1 Tax=Acetitomaculum ruminis TaxID=2382 RepID=UPI002E8E35B4|nr:leucine-rich repeat protein [Acetitomaculum ruminis]
MEYFTKIYNYEYFFKVFDEEALKNKHIDYVTLTLGGNDVDFSQIITIAVAQPGTVMTAILKNKIAEIKADISTTEKNLERVYKGIRNKTDNDTKIIVAGYPHLISDNGGVFFTDEEARIINNDGVDYFNNNVIKKIVNRQPGNIYYVDVVDEFKGHEAYSSDPYINPIMILQNEDINALKIPPISEYSIHPNNKGTDAYARCVQRKIDSLAGNYEWVSNTNGTLVITNYNGTQESITLPTYIDNKKVIGIDSIGNKDSFKNIKTIKFPEGIWGVISDSFRNRTNLKEVYFEGSGLVFDSAFENCPNLTTVTFNDFTSIDKNAFKDCINLKSVNVNYTVGEGSQILPSAFENCKNLIHIDLDKFSWICASAFKNCTSLSSVTLSNKLTAIGENAFIGCTALKGISIPKSVTIIGNSAFEDCKSLMHVELPERLGKIESATFRGCTGLKDINIPVSVKEIGSRTFEDCTSLTNVKLSEGLEKIGSATFCGCTALKEIRIPASVKTIGESAFSYCKSLTHAELKEGLETIEESTFEKCTGLKDIRIPTSVKTIGADAFYECKSLTHAELKEGLETIEGWAFANCTALKDISIPKSVKTIGSWAFGSCNSLMHAELSEGLETIGDGTFSECTALIDIRVPKSVKTIGVSAFKDCKNLTYAELQEGLVKIEGNAFYNCEKLKEINIPKSVKTIGRWAFGYCKSLTRAELQEGLGKIEDYTFCNCFNLKEIRIPKSVKTIGESAFCSCWHLKQAELPEGLETIGDTAFQWCGGLEAIKIPKSVKKIGKNPWLECEIVNIQVDSSNKKYDSRNNCNGIIETATNTLIVAGYKTLIPKGVNTVKSSAINTCHGIYYDIYLPKHINKIINDSNVCHIKGFYDSYAEKYAKSNGIEFIPIIKYTVELYDDSKLIGKKDVDGKEKNKYGIYTGDCPWFSTAEKKGYELLGYNTKKDGSGKLYTFSDGLYKLTRVENSTVKLYAQWKIKKYKITYNLNGGKNNADNPTTYTVKTKTIKLKNPTRQGYSFVGWYTDKDYKKKLENNEIKQGSVGNKTLYAKWKKNGTSNKQEITADEM